MVVMEGSVPRVYARAEWRLLAEGDGGSIGIAFTVDGERVSLQLERAKARRLGAALVQAAGRPWGGDHPLRPFLSS